MSDIEDGKNLRSGWTTGACATAAAKAACLALFGEAFPQQVTITLPRGETPSFALALAEQGDGWARAGVIKDAGDDPDVTHGATIIATLRRGEPGSGIVFRAGFGIGTVTKPGLPLSPGEPAINPVPRRLMSAEVVAIAKNLGQSADIEIEISVPGGDKLALATWNPRLGILGGISILGTTGVVVPYSCSAWIHSIQRGIDVARATGVTHVVASVGNTSEKAALALTGLSPEAVIDMGDFVGGMLKYLRRHPVARVTVAGGFAKVSKLAAGAMDLHSKRSQVDLPWLSGHLRVLGAAEDIVGRAEMANTALEVLELAQAVGLPLGDAIAAEAVRVAQGVLDGAPVQVDVLVFDRKGRLAGSSHTTPI
ncbi:Putative cobalt-precorrin-6A synthase, cbiD [Magnetospirillum gryphiswaldense MSR-1 v2]|uniref:Cobalt-precorrin-5B C(1)-methyltransferase n=1 Tax=Magnetospirillum gryphiswaldense (strain DSM 6361 / JCM 21280 / NBRC 15271 / MSR-1) TaxID=431944 RepID=V6F3H9_MAGGM|nr:cobalt-precorrin-5B (C(1))-methyltransferase [Magnetospirillum gryphiswaldense]CDL00014.1 Putative cobalt-precorrin-6A synthase, cbiD [Magnetospirillum gryphiswaldense MSR-1 v2]